MKKAFIQLHLAVFLAGFTAILGKKIGMNEGWVVWYRLLIAVVILFFLLKLRKKLKRIDWRLFAKITGVGAVLAIHWLCFYASVKYANASIAVVCISAAGFFSSFLEPFILKRSIKVAEVALGLLSILGIYIIFDFHPQFQTGILFGILAAIGSALFPIYNKRLLAQIEPDNLTFYEFLGGWLVLSAILPVYFIFFPAAYHVPSQSDWGWLWIMAAFCTVWAFDLQLFALKHLSPFTVNLTYNLEPVYGVGLAFLLLNESQMLNRYFYVGIFLIICSITIQMWRVRENKSA